MQYDHHRTIRGFSLIELLVGIVISSILVIGAYNLLTAQQTTYVAHDDSFEMQQNLRIAMERMAQDLTMAGFGKPTHLGRTSWPMLNGTSGIDYSIQVSGGNTLDIVGCLAPPEGHVPSALTAGLTTIPLASGEAANFNTTTKSDISIGGAENAKVVGVSSDAITIDTNPALAGNQGLANGYAANVPVYTVMHVTYSVGSAGSVPVLMIDKHQGAGGQPIAQLIEGMNVALNGNALVVTLTGRTRNPSRTSNQYVRAQSQNQIFLRNLPNISY
jgi:prepilin-type N-terminal cleavage/methylation domain-containing protein